MNFNKINHEKLLIIGLLCLTLFFVFWVIPNSIIDPENFGIKDGLPPSFAAYLVGLLTLFTLAFQFINIFILKKNNNVRSGIDIFSKKNLSRSFNIILICLLYSFLFIEYLGFYLGSFIFIIVLSFILGEKRVLILSIFSIFLVLFIYVGFNIGFNIFLPESKILKQVFEGILN
jgi:hypothetical protein